MKLVRETDSYISIGAFAQARARSRQSRFLNEIRDRLTRHVGNPNPMQELLIGRCALAMLRLEQMDQSNLQGEPGQDHETYLKLLNSVTNLLARLGMTPADVAPPAPAPEAA